MADDTPVQAVDNIEKYMEELNLSLERSPIQEIPEGLRRCLNKQELLLLAWLSWREREHPCGGILVDEKDFETTFKTLIALVVKEKNARGTIEALPVSIDFIKSNTTLIICPVALVDHCALEVERRCNRGKLTVHKYYGPNRAKSAEDLIKYDLVITTYGIISRELEGFIKEEKGEEATTDLKYAPNLSVLAKVYWNRIILGEAMAIKDGKTQAAKVICKLKARARWAMTGKDDKLLNMKILIRFLKFSPFDEQKMWEELVRETDERARRLVTIEEALFYSVCQG